MAESCPLSHSVFFTLKDPSDENISKMISACEHYLTGHEGTIHFSTGRLASELQREVNDLDFHVSLNVFFESKAAHDVYQTHPRHLEFIEKHKEMWAGVRVFDSHLDVCK